MISHPTAATWFTGRRYLIRLSVAVVTLNLWCPHFCPSASAAEPAKRTFDLPAGKAEVTLRTFIQQAKVELIFTFDKVDNVTTNAVKGQFTAPDALSRMLANTDLHAVQDPKTGALAVRRQEPPPPEKNDPGRTSRQALDDPADRTKAKGEETIQLSVFEVAENLDDSYGSTNSTSITGTRKDLRRMPVSAEVMNRILLDDLGAIELREILEFAPGTGAFIISGGSSDPQGNQPGDRIGEAVGSLRGLSVGMRRNGFSDNGSSFDSFSKERVEIIRGPQALLYGATNASGIIVVNTKRPNLARNSARIQLRTDSEGSRRAEFSFNAAGRVPFTSHQFGLLATAFENREKFWRVNNEIKSHGLYVAGAWKPARRITVRADYETAYRHAIDPGTIRLGAPVTHAAFGSRNNEILRLLVAQGRAADLFNGGLTAANAEAFGTDLLGEVRMTRIFSSQIEAEVTPWLSFMVQGGLSINNRIRHDNSGALLLIPPGLNNNPTGDWAVQLNPMMVPNRRTEKAYRALANLTLPAFRAIVRSELSLGGESRINTSRQLPDRWYELDANGEFIRNPAQLNNASSGRTLLPSVWWAPGREGFDGPAIFRSPPPSIIELNGRRYASDTSLNTFPQFVTPDNPFGYSSAAPPNFNRRTNDAAFAVLSSSWFGQRLDTLAGYRFDWLTSTRISKPAETQSFNRGSHMIGINYHVTRSLTPYYAHSTSFQPSPSSVTILNEYLREGTGVGDELGLKFGLLDDKVAGSVSVYSSKAKNNSANLPSNIQTIVDPTSSVNGRRNGASAYGFDRETKGYEINVTAAPVRGWRIQVGFSHIAARDGADVYLPILYNDQFHANATGQVTFADGRPLLVPVNPATTGWNSAMPAPGVPAQPLTINILRNGDANGNYRANLNPNSGVINNAAALFLNTPGVGTGTTGLPISQHQLGFVPPTGGTFLALNGGDRTTGYAANAVSFTTNYRIAEGRLRGLALGGNARMQLDQASFFYVDRQTDPANPVRRAFFTPDILQVNLICSYEIRLKRRGVFRTQLNVANVMDSVKTIIFPDVADGSPDNARLSNPPRTWVWANTVQF